MKQVAFVLAGLLLGGALATIAIHPVFAQNNPTAARPKWQQYCEAAATVQEASTIAAARGAEGWELVSFAGGAMCFKRPVAPSKDDTGWPGY